MVALVGVPTTCTLFTQAVPLHRRSFRVSVAKNKKPVSFTPRSVGSFAAAAPYTPATKTHCALLGVTFCAS